MGSDGVKKTWAEKASEVQEFYTAARKGGSCKMCGVTGVYLVAGPHPSGFHGQPTKACKDDLEKIKEWVEVAGFVCQRCRLTGGATTAFHIRQSTPRHELKQIKRALKPLRDAKQSPETCEDFLASNMKHGGLEAVERLRQSSRWMDPAEFRALLAREQELTNSIK